MLDRLLHFGLWVVFAITATIALTNAFYMLISPNAWFALPNWLALHGVMKRKRYPNRWGGLEVRVLGAIIIAAAVWIALGLLGPNPLF